MIFAGLIILKDFVSLHRCLKIDLTYSPCCQLALNPLTQRAACCSGDGLLNAPGRLVVSKLKYTSYAMTLHDALGEINEDGDEGELRCINNLSHKSEIFDVGMKQKMCCIQEIYACSRWRGVGPAMSPAQLHGSVGVKLGIQRLNWWVQLHFMKIWRVHSAHAPRCPLQRLAVIPALTPRSR